MGWSVGGRSVEWCNCRVMCPCWLGPDTEPDQGWCGGAFAFDIEEGSADGVELNGRRAVLVAEWPGNFFLGGGTGRGPRR